MSNETPGFTAAELKACATREVGQRRRVYRHLVAEGRMTQEESDRQIAMMEAIAEHFGQLAAEEAPQRDLFGRAS